MHSRLLSADLLMCGPNFEKALLLPEQLINFCSRRGGLYHVVLMQKVQNVEIFQKKQSFW